MSDPAALQAEAKKFREVFARVRDEVKKVIVGQDRLVEGAITALFCGGHVLLEGVPGLGKTELVKAMGGALALDFRRIQFTPDLMPADIIGTNVMSTDAAGHYQVEFKQGPIFTQLLLADEINRATPKTQSALLETMQERTVTVGGLTRTLTPPFFVIATQNPIEQEGTYPLPEAQLDRFMFKLEVPFIGREDLNEVINRTILRQKVEAAKVLDAAGVVETWQILDKVVVADPLRDYAVRLILATHPGTPDAPEQVKRYVRWGASPRAAQALIRAGRVRALADGRAHLAAEDIRHHVVDVLQHRVLLNYDGQAENLKVQELVAHIVEQVGATA